MRQPIRLEGGGGWGRRGPASESTEADDANVRAVGDADVVAALAEPGSDTMSLAAEASAAVS